MDRSELGKLIKEARLAKKMTQSEVVGNFITRNMLSQIESGTAIPSIKTLEYLSQKLDISIQMLSKAQSDAPTDAGTGKAPDNNMVYRLLKEGKHLYQEGEYQKAIKWIKPNLNPSFLFYDEFCSIYSRCCLALAKEYAETQPDKSRSCAEEGAKYSDKGIYASADIANELNQFLF